MIGPRGGHFVAEEICRRPDHPLKQFLRHYAAYENTIWTNTRDKNRGNSGFLFAIRARTNTGLATCHASSTLGYMLNANIYYQSN